MKSFWPSLTVMAVCVLALWIFWSPSSLDRAGPEAPSYSRSESASPEISAKDSQRKLPVETNGRSSGSNAERTLEQLNGGQEPLPLGYAQLKNDDFYAAMQLWEAQSQKAKTMSHRIFFRDLRWFCALAYEPYRIAEVLKYNNGPLQAHYQWASAKAKQICQGFRARRETAAELERGMALFGNMIAERKKAGNQIGAWNDQQVILADSAEELWMLSGEGFQGDVGGEIFDFRPQAIRTGFDAEYNLSLAQRMAITRIRCEMTHACGPEQLDSILVCMRFQMCGPGVSVEQVWSNVASAHQRKAADAIYQMYSEARRSARAHRAGGAN